MVYTRIPNTENYSPKVPIWVYCDPSSLYVSNAHNIGDVNKPSRNPDERRQGPITDVWKVLEV